MLETALETVWGVLGLFSKASGSNVHLWRVKAHLGAAAAQYNTSGMVGEDTLNSIAAEQVRKNMGTCNISGCDSCWHM
jgi:hypothetical protein